MYRQECSFKKLRHHAIVSGVLIYIFILLESDLSLQAGVSQFFAAKQASIQSNLVY